MDDVFFFCQCTGWLSCGLRAISAIEKKISREDNVMRIVVTGGAGYIGSHTTLALLQAGHDVLILDSFVNAQRDVPDRVAEVAGRSAKVVVCDIRDAVGLNSALAPFNPEATIHFAGLKAVGEAVNKPLEYFRVNVCGSITLFQELAKLGCNKLVFSSSATVYGTPVQIPIPETHALNPTNPYGRSKLMIEQVIQDWSVADPTLSAINLRYFNPVGAHDSKRIGEAPSGRPNNLMPFISQVAAGWRKKLMVFGDDYDTPDGTGVRDYVHVMDLAAAHIAALDQIVKVDGVQAINVGTGHGYSVLDILRTFERVSGKVVPYVVIDRRPGDVAASVANPAKAREIIDWQATRDLEAMCQDTWAWQLRCKR